MSKFDIQATVSSKIGFASHQNAVPLVRELIVEARGSKTEEGLSLRLFADPPFLQEKTWRIERMQPGDRLEITDRSVSLSASFLHEVAERMTGEVTFELLDSQGASLARATWPVELLARNEWGGLGDMAELLPAFVMPNDPAVDRILKSASDALRRAGKSDAIDGYISKERKRVWELSSAIWAAVSGLRLTYSLPPASFEQVGQKVRNPSAVLEGGLATCLDTALLFASALEQAGLNPILVLTRGHAFVGVWLQPIEFSTLLTDEAAAIRRRFDIDDLLLFETTLATQSPPAGFVQAIAAARRQVDESVEASFEMAIDVRRARIQKIRPLAVALAPQQPGSVPEAQVSEALELAPELPAFDVDVEVEPDGPGGRIRQWQRKLLNLTTSNRLLHLPDGAKVLKLLCPDPGALEDLLSGGRKIRISPVPELTTGGRDEALYQQQTQESLRAEVAQAALARGETLSPMPKDRLDALLIELYRKARSDLEEGGANTLYLALGFLKWKKTPNEERTYRAPLVLMPVRLERKSAMSGVVMSAHEDEPRFNLTLLELLRQDFELVIPGLEGELPKDASGVDVPAVWRAVRTAVRDMAGFEVVPDVAVGTFSFAKYLMWKDLVDRSDRLRESPVVSHLIDRTGDAFAGRGDFPRPERLDELVDPASIFTPLPADSSQLTAVVASAQGRDFVLDGPPGTGKSQTIANMIAHNLAVGRRVLFVAEKRAALDVVQRRLADKGLGPFCLELHSAKATKSEVLKQLDRAWTARDALSETEWQQEAAAARRLRDELNEVVALLHRSDPSGWTLHRAIGRTVRDLDDGTPVLSFPPGTSHDRDDMVRMREVVRRLAIARGDVGGLPPGMEGIGRTEWSNGWQQEIVSAAAELLKALDALHEATEAARAATRPSLALATRDDLARTLDLLGVALECHGRDMRFAFLPDLIDRAAAARSAGSLIAEYRSIEAELSARYSAESARRIDLDGIRTAWTAAGRRFWFLATLGRRKVARQLADAGGVVGPVDVEADLPKLSRMRELLDGIDDLAPRAAAIPSWNGLGTDVAALEGDADLALRLRSAIGAASDGPDALAERREAVARLVLDANDVLAPDGRNAAVVRRLTDAVASLDLTRERFDGLAEAEGEGDLTSLRDRARAVRDNASRLAAWANWRRVRDEAIALGLLPLVTALEHGDVQAARAGDVFEVAYARWFAGSRIDAEPVLTRFVAGEQEDRIARFRELDARMADLASRYIRARLCGSIPDKNDAQGRDGYGVLKHQLQLQRPSKPIRQLAADMGEAFTRLAPCMLMSPLSIAQYLPADQELFDLVIFDEASQITPWDAIGAMARGRQVVIAGDPRQMPPSSDFQRGVGSVSADEDVEPDLDSILDECLGAGVPQHSLDWHYRSRHESLITFSNHRYYEGRLVTFPAPVTQASAVSWRRVDGVWARGAEKTNAIEARAIVDEAVARLRDPNFVDAGGRPMTLAIITMNAEQMRLVEDLLDKARRAHPEIEPHFDAEQRLEPVVVRNLETAQGDERDVILLGISFGPTEPGGRTMSMNFGKLNMQGGWRRLNVAVTRARQEMVVFTSFDPGMIDLSRTSQRAIADLKHFIQFAERGPRALAEADRGSVGGMDSPFEEAVAWELQRRGWTVVPQVGVSRFRIDLGIVHPDRPGDFLLGVECDGATYHSAATARDRDRVRASILQDLGWSLERVWSTDWWIDRRRAADRLHERLEEHLARSRASAAEHAVQPAASVPTSAAETERGAPSAPPEVPSAGAVAQDVGHEDGVGAALDDSGGARGRLEPTIAGASGPGRAESAGKYRRATFEGLSEMIDPDAFYDASYDPVLCLLVKRVLECEAPVSEGMLVQRIARAHGFQRTGRVIRDRIMTLAGGRHHLSSDGVESFVWLGQEQQDRWRAARAPSSEEDIRQIEDISLEEIGATGLSDPVAIARFFGIRRLSSAARSRIADVEDHVAPFGERSASIVARRYGPAAGSAAAGSSRGAGKARGRPDAGAAQAQDPGQPSGQDEPARRDLR
ncbi:DUF3320 domain-containing protein [Sphingomonas sp. BK069]|uniref:DUF3320 domain-containing protein n=1 Tax=Sphingomonas sp. BK069 TaxID=2586979 RepID=UPI0017D02DE6|nr:DUF3320 domain-containing protein [Sphingomonas sp. BK069]MBB3348344.1 very-short-patch-repair endonuclease [Sphingomonas sp. BK069]